MDYTVLAELEACSYRNKTPAETVAHMNPLLEKYLPLASNASIRADDNRLRLQRQKDHYSHFILRLAFASTEDLRRRFSRLETMLFKLRFQQNSTAENRAFVGSLNLNWETVSEEEKREMGDRLKAASNLKRIEDEGWFKVDWERVPELVERRSVYLTAGQAYVPLREQASMVFAEFTTRLDKALEVRAFE